MINNLIVSSYIACPYKAFLLLSNEPQPENDYLILMNQLKEEYKLSFIASLDTKNILPFQLTFQTKKDFITVNPVVKDENFEIQFDAFEINHPIGNPGTKPVIKPLIILPAEKITRTDKLYAYVVGNIASHILTNFQITQVKVRYGKELKVATVDLPKFEKEANRIIWQLRQLSSHPVKPVLRRNSHCNYCQFQPICREKLLDKDDMSLLGGVNEKYISLRNNRGIFTINQLSFTFRPRKYKKAKNRRKRYYPELKALAIRNNQFYL